MSDPLGATAQTTVRFPSGETPPMTRLAEQLRELLRHDGLAHLVLYDGDTATVALDAATAHSPALSQDSHEHERAGRQIYYLLEELQPDFNALRTGALIRTVLRVPSGAVLYYQVEPGFHLYAATSERERLDELDASMAECANRLRLPARYSPLNYGSWFNTDSWALLTEPEPEPADAGTPEESTVPAEPPLDEDPPETSAAPVTARDIHVRRPETAVPPPAAEELLREALDVRGLHYVAYHQSPGTAWVQDIFGHPALGDFFRVRTPDQRRERYARMSRLLPGVAGRMNLSLRAILGGELVQLVLDVEQGAVYFHTLSEGRYLIGVTLDQSRVTAADHRLARLAKELPADGPSD